MAWFSRWRRRPSKKPDETWGAVGALEQFLGPGPVPALGARLVGIAIALTQLQVESAGLSGTPSSWTTTSPAFSVLMEQIVFLLHICDRAILVRLGSAVRDATISELIGTTFLVAHGAVGPGASIEEHVSAAEGRVELYDERLDEYAGHEAIVAESLSPSSQAASVLGAFVAHLPEAFRAGFPDDLRSVILAHASVANSITLLKLDEFFAELSES